MTSSLLVQYLVKQAKQRHGKGITPAGTASTFKGAVTECSVTHTITFWYNVPGDDSTHNIILRKEHV
jgi:hypothetical protein